MTFGVRKAAFDSLTATRKDQLRRAATRLRLGEPATYSDGTELWLCFDDSRFGDGKEWMDKAAEWNASQHVRFFPEGLPSTWEPQQVSV